MASEHTDLIHPYLATIGDLHWSGLACAVCAAPLGGDDGLCQLDGQMRGVCTACIDDADAEADTDATRVFVLDHADAGADDAVSCTGCGTPISGRFDASALPANVAWVCADCAPTYDTAADAIADRVVEDERRRDAWEATHPAIADADAESQRPRPIGHLGLRACVAADRAAAFLAADHDACDGGGEDLPF